MSATKSCIKCGEDCSNRPRSKDAQGRYICQSCIDSIKAAKPAPPTLSPPQLPADDGTLALAIEDAAPKTKPCKSCGSTIPEAALLCTSCGFDFVTGKSAAAAKKPGARTCIKCGYDLTGVKSSRCPECGTFNTDASRKAELNKRDRQDNIRSEYLKPLYMLFGGLAVATAAAFLSGHQLTSVVITLFLQFAISAVLGTIAFFFACLFWMGFDAPFHLTALRLLGIAAVCEAVWQVTAPIPIPFVASAALLITYIGLLQSVMSLDLQDAMLFAVVNWVLKVFIVVAIVTALSGAF